MWAKQSTAATLIVGPILDSAGAEYASAVIGDLSISKNGGTLTAMAAAATLTHIANGQYTLVTTTGNIDTLGRAQITCNKSTYQMPPVNLMVVPAMVFDSMVMGTDVMQSDVTQLLGTAWLTPAVAGTPDVNLHLVKSQTLTASAAITFGVYVGGAGAAALSTGVNVTALGGSSQSATDLKDFADTGYDPAAHKVAGVVLVDTLTTYTGNTPQTGDSFARIGATGSGLTSLAPSATALSTATWTGTLATNIGTTNTTVATNLDATVSSRLASASYSAAPSAATVADAVWDWDVVANPVVSDTAHAYLVTSYNSIASALADTNELQTDWANGGRLDLILDARASQTSVDDVPTNAELATAITVGLTTALTEGYRSTGATGSVRDLLYEVLQGMSEFTISGTTKTVKKLDGSTTAKTYTLNDGTTPTGITETT